MAFLRMVRSVGWLVVAALVAAGLYAVLRDRLAPPPLDLAGPVGLATRARLAALRDDAPACRALLAGAGVAVRVLPPVVRGPGCGYADGVAWAPGGTREIAYRPAAPPLACPLAAALVLWEWEVVRPAAARTLHGVVAGIDQLGSYNCRRIGGGPTGRWSAHARADALDVAGFRLRDGRRITVARDWTGGGAPAAFLHAVRDGGCRLFGTTLSPDYNAAHRDHLHLEMGGAWGACR